MILANVADYREAARKRVPRFMFDYIDSGAIDETTFRRNVSDFEDVMLPQRVMRDVSKIDLGVTLFGQRYAAPIGMAPVGLAGMNARRGEVQAARAARAKDVPFTLSTLSLCGLEEVRSAVTAPIWFQFYMLKDRGFMKTMLARAREAGTHVLVFTVDLPVPGIRYKDRRSGLAGGAPFQRNFMRIMQSLARPAWCWDVGLNGGPHVCGNIASVIGPEASIDRYWRWVGENFEPSVTWRDLDAIRAEWPGALVIKGVLDVEDAKAAASLGAEGIVVSNHGGRQLDGALSTIRALPPIAEAVGDKLTVLLDGGVRSGTDAARAIALGAKSVLIGRAWAYGLAARGQRGVEEVLQLLIDDLRTTLALTGCTSVSELAGQAWFK